MEYRADYTKDSGTCAFWGEPTSVIHTIKTCAGTIEVCPRCLRRALKCFNPTIDGQIMYVHRTFLYNNKEIGCRDACFDRGDGTYGGMLWDEELEKAIAESKE